MSSPRRGATFVEVIVGAALLALVAGGAWYVTVQLGKSGKQVLQYGSVLQAAASIRARLAMDMAAAQVPRGADLDTNAVRITDGGRSVGFLRYLPSDDPAAAPISGTPQRWVQWSTEAGPGGTLVLKRELEDGPTLVWRSAPAREVVYRLAKEGGQLYLIAEIALVDDASAANPGGPQRRAFPLRLIRHLHSPARLPSGFSPFPTAVIPALPTPAPVAPAPVSLGPLEPPPGDPAPPGGPEMIPVS